MKLLAFIFEQPSYHNKSVLTHFQRRSDIFQKAFNYDFQKAYKHENYVIAPFKTRNNAFQKVF